MVRVTSVVAALCGALLVWLIGLAFGMRPTVRFGSDIETVGISSIVGVVVLAGIAAWGVDVLVRHTARHPQRVWLTVCLVVLAVSLLGPVTQAATIGSTTVLFLMHVVVGVAIGLGFTWRRASSWAVAAD